MSDPVAIVERGYDAIADRFEAWGEAEGDPRERFLAELTGRLPDGARVLEIGCGSGKTLARLADRFDVTGVELSGEQLRRAAMRAPPARLVHADICTYDFAQASFDAVAAFYVLGHIPRERHAMLYRRIADWLPPGGLLLASIGVADDPGTVEEWLGAPMFFSSWPPETNEQLLAEAGLVPSLDELVTMREPEASVTFQWVLARRRESPARASSRLT
jgi:cyclopropane fatty-acyl-phospholipid synthase-like methyltransferase